MADPSKKKERKAKPDDYFWCETCEVVVAKKHAVVEEDVLSESGLLCPGCKSPLSDYRETK